VKDAFRERLEQMSRGERTRTAGRRRATPAGLDDLTGVVRDDGVLVIERSLAELTSTDDLRSLLSRLGRASGHAAAREDLDDELRALLKVPDRALFFDTETTGLGGNMVFMLGVMRIKGEDVRLTQVLARDYREERELLAEWTRMLEDSGLLVSFNGKSFDMPVLRDRLGLHKVEQPDEPPHLDLLHHARRRWRGEFPDCRLQTLEWKVCGRRRSGDIPGEEIPAAYHRFVRTGDASDMLTVFHHNALDLITLADVALALAATDERRRGG
jgi:uncharacterized protein YprB with RNaseH-like and TPR domain